MQIPLDIPDEIAAQLQLPLSNISRRFLELIAADHYRQYRIESAELQRMLNFFFFAMGNRSISQR